MDPTHSFRRALLRRLLEIVEAPGSPAILAAVGGGDVVSVDWAPAEGERAPVEEVLGHHGHGPRFLVRGEARTSFPEPGGSGWSGADVAPCLAGLHIEVRSALAGAWAEDALREHASVASFARFALQLMAVGAPADLVAQAHRAALDEVRHARWCFGLAEAYGGEALAPSPFPFDGQVEVTGDLASLAEATASEGCIGGTLTALMAAERWAHAGDPAVRRILGILADDEARAAELAWRTVIWTLEQGGAPVREIVREVFDNTARHLPFGISALSGVNPHLAASHGWIEPGIARKAMVRALVEVILPCGKALLAPKEERAPDSGVRASRELLEDSGPATRRSPS